MPNYDDFIDFINTSPTKPGTYDPDWAPETISTEAVVSKNKVRQAGSEPVSQEFERKLRKLAETNLYFFSKAIIGRNYLTKKLHLPTCQYLQQTPPYRKGLLMPRAHGKTSIVSHCLPPHILIQPAETNVYFPSLSGTECRILLAGETEARAVGNLGTIKSIFERNQLFRALWPHVIWEKPRRDAPTWTSNAITIPRETSYPDPTIRAIGVGGAITGARPNVQIKDDLISLEAANSETVMKTAIDWHIASRALLDEYEEDTGLVSLEYIIGTRWAVYDLYQHIQDEDPTVEWVIRSVVENDKPIWPERFSLSRIEELKVEFGVMFWLLYMNQPFSAELVEFDCDLIRKAELHGDTILLEETDHDIRLKKKWNPSNEPTGIPRGLKLTSSIFNEYLSKGRGMFLRFKYG